MAAPPAQSSDQRFTPGILLTLAAVTVPFELCATWWQVSVQVFVARL
jgi:hypothetical protein